MSETVNIKTAGTYFQDWMLIGCWAGRNPLHPPQKGAGSASTGGRKAAQSKAVPKVDPQKSSGKELKSASVESETAWALSASAEGDAEPSTALILAWQLAQLCQANASQI